MAFNFLDGNTRRIGRTSEPEPRLSFYGPTGQFRINGAAHAALGQPERVSVLYDPETQRIALTTEETTYAVVLRSDSQNTPSRYFGFRSLARQAALEPEQRFSLRLEQDPETGYWVANLGKLLGRSTQE